MNVTKGHTGDILIWSLPYTWEPGNNSEGSALRLSYTDHVKYTQLVLPTP